DLAFDPAEVLNGAFFVVGEEAVDGVVFPEVDFDFIAEGEVLEPDTDGGGGAGGLGDFLDIDGWGQRSAPGRRGFVIAEEIAVAINGEIGAADGEDEYFGVVTIEDGGDDASGVVLDEAGVITLGNGTGENGDAVGSGQDGDADGLTGIGAVESG